MFDRAGVLVFDGAGVLTVVNADGPVVVGVGVAVNRNGKRYGKYLLILKYLSRNLR